MLAQSLLVVLAGLGEVSTYICAYCIEHACNLLQCHGFIKKYVSEEFFIFYFFFALLVRVLWVGLIIQFGYYV